MKRAITGLKLAVSLLFLGVLFFGVDRDALVAKAHEADVFYLLVSVGLSFAMVAASTWKWWYLLRVQKRPLPFLFLYRWYFIGYFYSNFLPSNVGGDVARAWLAGRACGSTSAAAASIFAERFTGMIFLLLMAVLAPLAAPSFYRHPAVLTGVAAGVGGLVVVGFMMALAGQGSRAASALLAVLRDERRPGWVRRLARALGAKAEKLAGQAGALLGIIRRDPRVFINVAGLTALFYGLMLVNVATAFRVFGIWPDPWAMTAVLPSALIVAMLPLTLGNLGIAEGSYVFFFGLAGMPAALTFAMGLLLRMKILMLGTVGLVFHLKSPVKPPAPS